MRKSIRKASFRCPSCSFVQQEPENLISTYCRSCGGYYEVKGQRADPLAEKPGLVHRAFIRAPRAVHCHRCGHDHEVSSSSHSTICPSCNASIEFGDLVFSHNVSRPVDTRGRLTIEKTGYLNNAYIVCGEAVIHGRINGTLRCEGNVTLGTSGTLSCRITAHSVTVERRTSAELIYPLMTAELVVHGELKADIRCGKVHIHRNGRLEGNIVARSVTVDKGGVFLANSTIQPENLPEAGAASSPPTVIQETGGLMLPTDYQLAY